MLEKKIVKKEIKNMMEKKFPVEINDVNMILFPIWKCKIIAKKGDKSRSLNIDAIFGNVID